MPIIELNNLERDGLSLALAYMYSENHNEVNAIEKSGRVRVYTIHPQSPPEGDDQPLEPELEVRGLIGQGSDDDPQLMNPVKLYIAAEVLDIMTGRDTAVDELQRSLREHWSASQIPGLARRIFACEERERMELKQALVDAVVAHLDELAELDGWRQLRLEIRQFDQMIRFEVFSA